MVSRRDPGMIFVRERDSGGRIFRSKVKDEVHRYNFHQRRDKA